MRPIKIEFQAFGPYAGYESVNFEDIASNGLFLICGRTGTGKTTILDAITFALYGMSSGNVRDDFESMRCTTASDNTDTFVRFEFENNGIFYIFERKLEKKTRSMTKSYSFLKKYPGGEWTAPYDNTKAATLKEEAENIIGLKYEQFIQVIMLPQGKFEKLLTSESKEKEEILKSIFGEDKWDVIAEKIYDDATDRKKSLETTAKQIESRLLEENCKSPEELRELIASKKEEADKLKADYEVTDYRKIIADQDEILKMAKRFEDLDYAAGLLSNLTAQKSERDGWEVKAKNAERAERVRELIEDAIEDREDFIKRKQNEAAAVQRVKDSKEALLNAETAYKDIELKTQEIEEKKKLKIQYESKRADYEGIDSVESELESVKEAEAKAREDEKEAKSVYDGKLVRETELKVRSDEASIRHTEALKAYTAGIAGILAAKLVEGSECPVCGSTSHPKKAVMTADTVTDEQVEILKQKAEACKRDYDESHTDSENAKTIYTEYQKKAEDIHDTVIAVNSKLESMKSGLIDGVDSLKSLDGKIQELSDEIQLFEERKAKLLANYDEAKQRFTDASAKLEPAADEVRVAAEKLQKSEAALNEGLIKNQFSDVETAKSLLMDEKDLSKIRQDIADYDAKVSSANDNLNHLRNELNGLVRPDKEKSMAVKANAQEEIDRYTQTYAVLNSDIKRLSEKLTDIENLGSGISQRMQEVEADIAFARTLRGDSGMGIQRYVLGIMFSSVVSAANKMLEKVHGGRYRLYRTDEKNGRKRQSGLELKVFDSHSSDHEGRFVNTLSGGEKFLTSLALSIGMSTVAQRSGIRIEALFIDEGFGSLDENSIGDAMDILNSIQEANGIVGIISHVQLLQDRIPTKLRVVRGKKGSHIEQTVG